jgi:capsular exopolysaccharide synthesis family protein
LVLAQTGRRVYLVDADLRRPTIHKAFGLPNDAGLTTILRGAVPSPPDAALIVNETLKVITSGPLPPNPAELLGSHRMRDLLGVLRADADMVIVDSPPLQVVTDAAVVAAQVDGTLLVIDSDRTSRSAVRDAWESLQLVDARLLGAVLNRAQPQSRT